MTLFNIEVLVVDDHALTRNLVTEILHTARCRVRTASDGVEAFDLIVREAPSIVISDLEMPNDGLSLLANIRRSPRSPDPTLPVIAMTSLTDKNTVLSLRDAGANEVISKPFSPQTVLGRVAAIIDQPRLFVRMPDYVGPDRRRKRTAGYDGPLRRSGERQVQQEALEL